MTEFADLGARCSLETCKQQDFLPFVCDACNRTFCLEHRTYDAHSCPRARANDRVAILCPVCGVTLSAFATVDADRLVCEHMESGKCAGKPAPPPQQCAFARCGKSIATVSVQCPSCKKKYCLQHRFEEDHHCTNIKKRKGSGQQKVRDKPCVVS